MFRWQSSSDNDEDNYIQQLSKLAVYLSGVIDRLEEHKTNLAPEYGSDALGALCNFYQQLTEEFDNHVKYERDPFYQIIRRSERRSRLTKQIAAASLTIAIQFEKYANGERKYSRSTVRRLLSNVIIPARSLYEFCTEAVPSFPIEPEVKLVDPITLPILLKALDFFFGEGSEILQERSERRNASQGRSRDRDDEGISAPKHGADGDEIIRSKESALKQKVIQNAWISSELRVNHLLSVLETHTRTYYLTKEQYAKYGSALVPPIIVHTLAEAEDGIAVAMQDLQNILTNAYGKKVFTN